MRLDWFSSGGKLHMEHWMCPMWDACGTVPAGVRNHNGKN